MGALHVIAVTPSADRKESLMAMSREERLRRKRVLQRKYYQKMKKRRESGLPVPNSYTTEALKEKSKISNRSPRRLSRMKDPEYIDYANVRRVCCAMVRDGAYRSVPEALVDLKFEAKYLTKYEREDKKILALF